MINSFILFFYLLVWYYVIKEIDKGLNIIKILVYV